MKWWRVNGLEVCGPYRDPATDRITAMSALEQKTWAESIGGRLPTETEVVTIARHACVIVTPKPRNVATAPHDALHDDVEAALANRGEDTERVMAGKTWVQHSQSSSARATNFGWLVPAQDVDRGRMTWRGIRVYPTSDPGLYAIQPAAQAHMWGHVDYSQLGYAVRDRNGASDPPEPDSGPDTLPRPSPTTRGDQGALVVAWQEYLIAYFASRSEKALPRFGADGDHGGETELWTQRWLRLDGQDSQPGSPVELPPISFKQAQSYYPARRNGPPIWVVIHTAEAIEHERTSESLQSWAASGRIGVSWHYAVDNDSIAQSVKEEHTAWAAPGANARGIQIELAGYARQSPDDWHDAFSAAQLQLCARLVANICNRWDIPVRKVGPDEMLRGVEGICGHVDVTRGVGKGRTNHGDPGKHFPWDEFIALVRGFMS